MICYIAIQQNALYYKMLYVSSTILYNVPKKDKKLLSEEFIIIFSIDQQNNYKIAYRGCVYKQLQNNKIEEHRRLKKYCHNLYF